MAVVEMRKLVVIGLNNIRTPFLQELMALGVVQINSQEGQIDDQEWMPDIFRTSNSADVSRLEADILRVHTALDAINRYDEGKKPLFLIRDEFENDAFDRYMDKEKTAIERNVDTAFLANKTIVESQNEINRLSGLIVGLEPWKNSDLPLQIGETETVSVLFGTTNAKTNFAELAVELQVASPSVIVEQVSADPQQMYISFICLKEERDAALDALRKFSFNMVALSDHEGTAAEAIGNIEKQIEKWETKKAQAEDELKSLSGAKKSMSHLYDSLCVRRDRAKIVGNMVSTEEVFYFDGWMLWNTRDDVEALLEEYDCYFRYEKPAEDEEPPVFLNNGNFATPFEAITSMYSLPSSKDIDPTKWLAPFYFIFFGMMLSDAAYGIIISVVCAVAIKKYKLEGSLYRMVKMFFYCGISTFFWGAMFGGWFGDFFTVAAKLFFGADFTIQPIWFNPLEEPMTLLVFSLILGAIHLFVGMGLQASILIKEGKKVDALCDIGLWYLLLIGLVLYGVGGMVTPALGTIGMVMSIVGAVGIVATGGRTKKGIVGKITGGLGSLYGITSYLSDVLSYSRLLALGLATGVIAQVINLLGSLAGGGITGAIVLTIAFLFGTVFNIAINMLGAFVHSCRLQYVEFFGKFYTGGGKPFEPFERKTKYIKIIKEEKNNG
ncbi:V-type ATP synthase subunit I [Chakrabartyella piscis]|uniref:V-type ATP synthase subunit I n=1 Tax=Chakrabartyella piscis TaxID=2918914 RepID=UPI0029587176|nr:V-type ATP synthase subunit I [Chakrabartyella piscis]